MSDSPASEPIPLVTGDKSLTFKSARYQQHYHSSHGAVTEARQVYLHGSGVAARLDAALPTNVLEIGFGLGLNYLVTADYAQSSRTNLHYVGIEHDLISATRFAQLHYERLLSNPGIALRLGSALTMINQPSALTSALTSSELVKCPTLVHVAPKIVRIKLSEFNTLELSLENASDFRTGSNQFDVIYLDAFSPNTNPECWTPELLSDCLAMLKPGGALASYCVKGSFRRALESVGFRVEKRPGPVGKREVLVAFRT